MRSILGILLIFAYTWAGDVDRTNQITVWQSGLSVPAMHSIGFSNMNNPLIAEISSANPAALSSIQNMSAGINFVHNTTIDIDIVKISRSMPYIPEAAGFVLPFEKFNLGIGYRQKYNVMFAIDNMDYQADEMLHSASLLGSYGFDRLFSENDVLSLGFQIAVDNYDMTGSGSVSGKGSGWGYSWMAGIKYDLNSRFSAGLMYEAGTDVEVSYEMDENPPNDEKYYFLQPDHLVLGLNGIVTNEILLSLTADAVLWNELDDYYENSLDLSASCIVSITQEYDISFGAYTSSVHAGDLFSSSSSILNYLGIGVRGNYDLASVYIEILNSDFSSDTINSHSVFKVGMEYIFK